MDIGIYGMGRMGFNMARRLVDKGYHRVIVGNRSPGKLNEAVERGAEGAYSVEEFVQKQGPPRRSPWVSHGCRFRGAGARRRPHPRLGGLTFSDYVRPAIGPQGLRKGQGSRRRLRRMGVLEREGVQEPLGSYNEPTKESEQRNNHLTLRAFTS